MYDRHHCVLGSLANLRLGVNAERQKGIEVLERGAVRPCRIILGTQEHRQAADYLILEEKGGNYSDNCKIIKNQIRY